MQISKTNEIIHELTMDDQKKLNDFIEGRLSQQYFIEKYRVSRQYLHVLIRSIDDDAFKKKEKFKVTQLKKIHQMALQGIIFEDIIQFPEMKLFLSPSMINEERKGKESIIRRFHYYGLIKSNEEGKFVMTRLKAEAYVSTLQIAEELEKYFLYRHMLLTEIADKYNSSYQKVATIKDRIEKMGTPLPDLPDKLIEIIERNIDIVREYRKGTAIIDIARQCEINEETTNLIISGYDPYVI